MTRDALERLLLTSSSQKKSLSLSLLSERPLEWRMPAVPPPGAGATPGTPLRSGAGAGPATLPSVVPGWLLPDADPGLAHPACGPRTATPHPLHPGSCSRCGGGRGLATRPSRDAGSLRVFVDDRSPYYLGLLLLVTNGNKQREANGPHGKCNHSGSGTGTPPHGADELEVWPLGAKCESHRRPRPIGKNKVAH